MILTEQLLAEAAAEIDAAMMRGLPEPEECRPEFSRWFEQKMKRVLRRGRHPAVYRVMQRAAAFVLVLFLGFAAIMAVSPTVRASVWGWIREKYESFNRYYFEDRPADDVRNAEYYIAGLEADYELLESNGTNGNHFDVYKNSAAEYVYFSYATNVSVEAIYIEEEGYRIEQANINGEPADIYISEDETKSNCIFWSDHDNKIMFYISGHFDADGLIALAESVCRKSEEPVVEKPADYVLTGLPEGYTEYVENDAPDIYTILYTNADGKPLYFVYSRDPDAANVFLKAEGYVVEEASVHGMDADVYLSSDPEQSSTIIWCDGSTQTMFYISACMDKEELITLAESVGPPEEEPTMYYISDFPQEYTEVTSFFNEELGEYTGVYCDADENYLYFMYSLIPEISNYYLGSTENYIIEQVYIDGSIADYYQSKDRSESNGIIWFDTKTNVVFFLSARMEKEELISMAESVEPVG